MSSVEFVMKIVDRATGPLKAIQGALKRVSAEAAGVKVVAPKIPAVETSSAVSRLRGFASNVNSIWSNLGSTASFNKIQEGGSSAFANISGIAGKAAVAIQVVGTAANIAGSALSAMGNGLMTVSKFAIDAASFKGDTLLGLKYIMGGKENAEAAYKLIQNMADMSPMRDEAIVGMFSTLKGAGFDTATTAKLVAGIADISLNKNANLESVTQALAKMGAKGKFNTEIMQQISESSGGMAGEKQIMAALEKLTGKKGAALEKALSAGEITAKQGEAAFFEALRQTIYNGDPSAVIGSAAKERSLTLGGRLSTLASMIKRLFADVNIGPLANAVGVLNDALGTHNADALKLAIEDLFGAFFGGASGLTGYDIAGIFQAATPVIHTLASGVRIVGNVLWNVIVPAGKAAFGTMGSILGTTLAPIRTLLGALFGINGAGAGVVALTAIFKLLAIGISVVVTFIAYIAVGFATIVGASASFGTAVLTGIYYIPTALMAMGQAVWAFGSEFVSAGYNMMMGLVDGIVAGAEGAIAAAVGVATNIVQRVKAALGIASPSKVFMEVGGYTSTGLAVGINDQAPQAQKSALRLVHSVKAEGQKAEGALKGIRATEVKPELQQAARAAGQPQQVEEKAERGGNQYTFHITVSGGDESIAAKVKQAVLEALREAGDGAGLEAAALCHTRLLEACTSRAKRGLRSTQTQARWLCWGDTCCPALSQ